MRYLAIDPGARRVGLAVGDDETRLATPLTVSHDLDAAVAQAVQAYGPDALVLGLPLNMDDTEGPAAKQARQLAARLEKRFGLRVHLIDERLSSAAAEEQLMGRELTHKGKRQRRDALAAAEILMRFFASSA